jgi:hypothetical protein
MGQLVLLVVAAAWAAVLVPPLLRSRIENRPNSSVSDFRDQLSSLQRAMPARGVSMRSMGRPLAQSPLRRPAAAGRPGVPAGRTHNNATLSSARANAAQPARRSDPARVTHDATPRSRSHASQPVRRRAAGRDAVKRRRANVLFVLALTVGCTLFLAATTRAQAMVWVAVISIVCFIGYVCLLGQLRQRDVQHERRDGRDVAPSSPRRQAVHRDPASRQREARRHDRHTGQVRRQTTARRAAQDRWSHAV